MTTCWTCSGSTSARSSARLIAMPPSSVASREARPPPSLPIGRAGGAEDDGLGHGSRPPWFDPVDVRDPSDVGSAPCASPPRPGARRDRRGHRRRRRLRGRGHRPRPRPARRACGALLGARGEAQPQAPPPRRRARRRPCAGSSSGSARATPSTPSARASPRPRCTAGRRSSGARTLCWELPHQRRATRSSRASSQGTLLAAYRFDRYREPTTRRGAAASRRSSSAPTTTSRAAVDRAAIVADAQNARPRPAEHARPTT